MSINYDNVLDQNPWWLGPAFPEEAQLPHRTCYDEIRKGFERPYGQAILGIRRVGKSTLLRQLLADTLARGTPPRHVFYFSFDRYSVAKTPSALEALLQAYFEQTLKSPVHAIRHPCYLFLDEIQYVDYWQDIVKRYYDQNKRLKFILTGSQSAQLRGKSSESLAGRLLEYHIPPLSYPEYRMVTGRPSLAIPQLLAMATPDIDSLREFHHLHGPEIESDLPTYLAYGQFPEVAGEASIDLAYQYIREAVLGKILEHDLPLAHRIEHIEAFKSLGQHLITNSSSLFELGNIGSELGLARATAERYLEQLRDSTLIELLYNQTRSAIKKGRSLKKAFAGSTCFICAFNRYPINAYQTMPEVFGKVVESYVWWRLKQQVSNLSFWRQRQTEVDFIVAGRGNPILPLEVKFGARIRNHDLQPMLTFLQLKNLQRGVILTRNTLETRMVDGRRIDLIPYCFV